MNIKDVEPRVAQKLIGPLREALKELSYPLPDGYQVRLSLLDLNGRKKRSNAAASNWSPESGRIEIRFEPARLEEKQLTSEIPRGTDDEPHAQPQRPSASVSGSNSYVHPAEGDLLKALDRAECKPGWNFVALKKFRDEILPLEHFVSMRTEVEQHTVLRSVIEKKFVLIGKVPNPKSPQFPVTTIRLNRLLPEVKAVLGHSANPDLDFHPVDIRGEPLSATILRDRR